MALHDRDRTGGGVSDVKRSQDPIHAARGDDSVPVLVPVMGENLGGLTRGAYGRRLQGRRMDRYGCCKVVLGRGWRSEVEDAEMRVGGYGRDQGGVGGAERCAVSTVSDGKGLYRLVSRWRPLSSMIRGIVLSRETSRSLQS